MKKNALLAVIAGAMMFPSCNKNDSDSDSASTATETGTEVAAPTSEEIEAARDASVKAALDLTARRKEFINAYQNPKSKIYTDAAEHRKTLKKMAAQDPVAFRKILDTANSLRFARRLPEISAKTFTGASLKASIVNEADAVAATPDLAACIKSKMVRGAPAAAGGAAPEWEPGDKCPDNCVCAAAWGLGFGYGTATAQCASGETIWVEAYAYAAAYAYAYACAPEAPADPGCADPEPEPDECGGVDPGADPFGPIIAENPDCLAEGKCGVVVPEETAEETGTDITTATVPDTGEGTGSGTDIDPVTTNTKTSTGTGTGTSVLDPDTDTVLPSPNP